MDPRLTLESVKELVAERRREAEVHRLDARGGLEDRVDRAMDVGSIEVTVRLASSGDAAALDHLSQLDSAALPTGPTLVAEQRGELVAALPLDGGRPIADPFRPTGELVRLLEFRAGQLSGERRRVLRRPIGRLARSRRTASARPRPAER